MKQSTQNKPLQKQQHTSIQAAQFYSGPLPPAEQLRQYEEICPGAADRILSMAENENRHRHQKENRALSGMLLNERLGMFSALTTCILTIAGGVYCISVGQAAAGAFISAVPLLGIVIAFIRGRKHNINL